MLSDRHTKKAYRHSGSLFIKFRIVECKRFGGIDVIVDGRRQKSSLNEVDQPLDPIRSIPGVTKRSLALRPRKFVLKGSQRHFSIGYDLVAGNLLIKH